MKKLILSLLTLTVLSCNTVPENGFRIEGQLRGDLEDSTLVFLRINDTLQRGMVTLDSTYLVNGSFEFSGETKMPELHYLSFDGIRNAAAVIIENGTIEFKAQKDSLNFAKVKGTEQNKMFMEFMDERNRMQNIAKTFSDDLRRANAANDTATVNSLREEYFELQEKSKNFNQEYIESHPNALMSALLLYEMAQRKTLPIEDIEKLSQKFSPEIQKTRPAKKIKELVETAKRTKIGAVAPDFSGPTPDGKQLALNDVKGKVTLIDFWAGWCRPCRMENPNIVSVYEKYKDKGLEIIGVSLDRNREQWLQAIEDDGLEWNQVSNVQYFQGPIAQLYNIQAIPAAFLLDENGVIIAKDLRGPALEAMVAELLK
ncbi:TlpA disulfide reductase family protein [Croceivirga thetidis]|uniref:AhpC/TSA family protein n=1 Tax=Croceivirga thetidis TaxID=2721623 RepID=A0ABX1GR30_9FLAO|nr:TlpA disulfide reductase family protein [Croceivirga thetidis]NKI32402.1 AhpC/TSA family protein [Croceivirga thetidis]